MRVAWVGKKRSSGMVADTTVASHPAPARQPWAESLPQRIQVCWYSLHGTPTWEGKAAMAGCMRYCISSSLEVTPASSRRLNSGTSRPSLWGGRKHGGEMQTDRIAQGMHQSFASANFRHPCKRATGRKHAHQPAGSLERLVGQHGGWQLLLVARHDHALGALDQRHQRGGLRGLQGWLAAGEDSRDAGDAWMTGNLL